MAPPNQQGGSRKRRKIENEESKAPAPSKIDPISYLLSSLVSKQSSFVSCASDTFSSFISYTLNAFSKAAPIVPLPLGTFLEKRLLTPFVRAGPQNSQAYGSHFPPPPARLGSQSQASAPMPSNGPLPTVSCQRLSTTSKPLITKCTSSGE